ncbi:MAG: type I-C CRISPR-associated endonuclease Cas1 [Elusimicrobia bacterium]|nr:type I-C CRISPR-associated endonuclease Cas1 [Elusimicrobiota bacterium]
MMHYLNTLFVTTQGAYLAKDGEAVAVRVEQETRMRVPLHNLGGIVCFGQVSCSPALMGECAERNMAISFMTETGRFLAKVQGFTPGNVLLRREQYRRADDPAAAVKIARTFVAAKIANCRTTLQRALRDSPELAGREKIEEALKHLSFSLNSIRDEANVETLRGFEGDAARVYFEVFDHLIVAQKEDFQFRGRNRRPPLDNVNALLSFLYSMLAHDARAACESAGLDAAVGFLHAGRPGRPSLALDLMEEFRPFLADRLALSLINRRQVQGKGFRATESGGVLMSDETRKEVLVAYQKRKQEEIVHPFLEEKCPAGLLPHLQARLLARHLRGDQDGYPPFIWK